MHACRSLVSSDGYSHRFHVCALSLVHRRHNSAYLKLRPFFFALGGQELGQHHFTQGLRHSTTANSYLSPGCPLYFYYLHKLPAAEACAIY